MFWKHRLLKSKKKKTKVIKKKKRKISFPRFFQSFEIGSSGDLINFLDVCNNGDLEGISELKLIKFFE